MIVVLLLILLFLSKVYFSKKTSINVMESYKSSVKDYVLPVSLGLFNFFLHIFSVNKIKDFIFDEIYYVPQAWIMKFHGSEMDVKEVFISNNPDQGGWWLASKDFVNGNTGVFSDTGVFVSHPPLGKWFISFGELLFGNTPLGWRVMPIVFSSLAIYFIARLGIKFFSNTYWGVLPAVLLLFDGIYFVSSNVAMLDIFVTFFVVLAFYLYFLDYEYRVLGKKESSWYRLLSIISISLGVAVKWSALPFALVLLIIIGIEFFKSSKNFSSYLLLFFEVFLGSVVYVLSWIGWFLNPLSWGKGLAEVHGFGLDFLPSVWNDFVFYNVKMFTSGSSFDSVSDYSSNPFMWFFMNDGTIKYFKDLSSDNLDVGYSVQMIYSVGNFAIWWLAIPAVLFLLVKWVKNRDFRFTLVLSGLIAGYIPWLVFSRTVFTYYVVTFIPFVVFALVFFLKALWDADDKSSLVSKKFMIFGYLFVVVIIFVYFYPLFVGGIVENGSYLSPVVEMLARTALK